MSCVPPLCSVTTLICRKRWLLPTPLERKSLSEWTDHSIALNWVLWWLHSPFTIHYSLLPVLNLDHPWNHSIFMANSFLSIFLALFFFCSEFMLLCCTFSWLSSMLCIYCLTIFFLGSFLGTWAESRGRHVHMFWLWYVPFLWISVDFIIMLCLCSWSTDASWNPGSNQSSLASLLGHFFWTGLFDLDAQ